VLTGVTSKEAFAEYSILGILDRLDELTTLKVDINSR
jgi:hypothetical protein